MLPTSSVVRHHEEQSDVQCVCAWCSQDKSLWLTSGMFWDFQGDAWKSLGKRWTVEFLTELSPIKSKSYECSDPHSRFYHSPATLAIFTSYFRFVHFGPRICPVGGAQHAVKRFTPVRPPPAETLKHLPREHSKPRNRKNHQSERKNLHFVCLLSSVQCWSNMLHGKIHHTFCIAASNIV